MKDLTLKFELKVCSQRNEIYPVTDIQTNIILYNE